MKRYMIYIIVLFIFSCQPIEVDKTTLQGTFVQSQQFQLANPLIKTDSTFFFNNSTIHLELGLDNCEIYFTLDGSEPDTTALRYKQAIQLDQTTTLKAKAYHPDYLPSETVQAHVFKKHPILKIEDIQCRTPNEKYPGSGPKGLVDGIKGSFDFRSKEWMGFPGGDLVVSIAFTREMLLNKSTVSFLSDPNSWIFPPAAYQLMCSIDGQRYTSLGSQSIHPIEEHTSSSFIFATHEFEPTNCKFVKVQIKNWPAIPKWHPGKGTPPWLFIDEIIFE